MVVVVLLLLNDSYRPSLITFVANNLLFKYSSLIHSYYCRHTFIFSIFAILRVLYVSCRKKFITH